MKITIDTEGSKNLSVKSGDILQIMDASSGELKLRLILEDEDNGTVFAVDFEDMEICSNFDNLTDAAYFYNSDDFRVIEIMTIDEMKISPKYFN